jgi:hypothetical protein
LKGSVLLAWGPAHLPSGTSSAGQKVHLLLATWTIAGGGTAAM